MQSEATVEHVRPTHSIHIPIAFIRQLYILLIIPYVP